MTLLVTILRTDIKNYFKLSFKLPLQRKDTKQLALSRRVCFLVVEVGWMKIVIVLYNI